MANTISNNRTSALINSQVPFFVRNDHQNFVKFLEKYYEYLEQNDKVINRIKNVQRYQDIDLTEDEFAQKLYDTFLKFIPADSVVDKALILKHIKDFYRAKGTEKSVRFLMQILYNESIGDFYYPKKDVLRASDGKWFVQRSLRVTDTQIANVANTSLFGLEKFVKTTITGATSNASAIVERVDRSFESGTQVDELIISNISGNFNNGEEIWATFSDVESTNYISANIFGGIVNIVTITNAGSQYLINDEVVFESNTGSGAKAIVSRVSIGNISSISVLSGGAGYQVNNQVVITGGGGSGATANVFDVLDNYSVHPNSYNIVASTISLEANTPINNTKYSNLVSSITDPANNWIANSMSYWTYANTGPIQQVLVLSSGSGYTSPPSFGVVANTTIISLGILGRMEIINGGLGYANNDVINFINAPGNYGVGALANVRRVNATGSIVEVGFVGLPGHQIGGAGYSQTALPQANVVSSGGSGANIAVTAILGAGADLVTTNTTIGAIEAITITSRGSGYLTPPTVNLKASGDGTATANASVIAGVFTYPGRYLNDDGHISSYNFLQDRDYYQAFSYVVRSGQSISNFRQALLDLTHPAGAKLFGQYDKSIDNTDEYGVTIVEDASTIKFKANNRYEKYGNTINVNYASHSLSVNSTVYLEFLSGGNTNVKNGIYSVSFANTNYFSVKQKSSIANIAIVNPGLRYNANSYIVFTGGDGSSANASYTTNANGAIISVTINDNGVNYTTAPQANANGSNAVSATFTVTLAYANSTNGNVTVGIIAT